MVTLGFNGNLNASINIGDTIYYVQTEQVGSVSPNTTVYTVAEIPEPAVGLPVAIGTVDSIQTNDINSIFYTNEVLTVTTNEDTDEEEIVTVNTIINVQETTQLVTPEPPFYFFFSKDNQYNMSSLTGYYGEVEFRNNSTTKAELYATACGVVGSS
jgi:hypothetical protein